MPTPHETTAGPPTPTSETGSSRASFASCPPEEDRERRASREARADTPQPAPPPAEDVRSDGRMTAQEPTPEPDGLPGAHESSRTSEDMEKGEHAEEAGVVAESSTSLVGSPDAPSDGDVRLAESMATTALEPKAKERETAPLYMFHPPLNKDRSHPNATSSFLRPGSKFRGTQQSDRQVYDVQVEIKDVDMSESFLCGYLRIQGLTDDLPTLTTFFEGEIIGPKYLFRTLHPSWNSSEKIDLQHWARFPAFRPLARSAKSNPSTFTLKNYLEREHLFMRWKEYFLVPDHRVKSISGASFEGFYYICFDQRVGSVSGIYFHAKSEKFQQLELQHVHDGGCMGAVEFR